MSSSTQIIISSSISNMLIFTFIAGHKPGEVGAGTEGSCESGRASDVDRVPGLEAVAMQTQAEALRLRHTARKPQVHSIRGHLVQPRDAER